MTTNERSLAGSKVARFNAKRMNIYTELNMCEDRYRFWLIKPPQLDRTARCGREPIKNTSNSCMLLIHTSMLCVRSKLCWQSYGIRWPTQRESEHTKKTVIHNVTMWPVPSRTTPSMFTLLSLWLFLYVNRNCIEQTTRPATSKTSLNFAVRDSLGVKRSQHKKKRWMWPADDPFDDDVVSSYWQENTIIKAKQAQAYIGDICIWLWRLPTGRRREEQKQNRTLAIQVRRNIYIYINQKAWLDNMSRALC